jgi:hypothetical protein
MSLRVGVKKSLQGQVHFQLAPKKPPAKWARPAVRRQSVRGGQHRTQALPIGRVATRAAALESLMDIEDF